MAPLGGRGAQYQIGAEAVSPVEIPAVSPSNSAEIVRWVSASDGLHLQQNRAAEVPPRPRSEIQAQYHEQESERERRELFLRIGFGLGLAYLVFLGVWIWATRVRPQPSRH